MFIGRHDELNTLANIYKTSNNSVLIYGKRRVGKTSLIKESIKYNKSYYFECVEDTLSFNLNLFINSLKSQGLDIPSYISFNSFIDAFKYLDSLNTKMIIVIDEYPYLKTMNNNHTIDSMFQQIIDNHINNINIIISGSSIKIMNELLHENNALYGRFKEVIYLDELNYYEAASFYNKKSIYDKIAFYSVFGGSPFINERINPDLSLKDNIINTFLHVGSSVYNYADNMLLSDVSNSLQAKRIVATLGNSKKKYKELESMLDLDKTGKINVSLKALQEIRLIRKVYPINKPNDVKKTFYETSDNALRFFYTYVYQNKSTLSVIGPNSFYEQYIKPSLITYISYRFEEMTRAYFSILSKRNLIYNVKNIGVYYYDDSTSKTNGEFDVVIEKNKGYDVFEVKYHQKPLDKKTILEEISQLQKVKEISFNSIGFVSASGFDFTTDEYILIDAKTMYEIDKNN